MHWEENNNALEAEFVFRNFKEAFAFMTECAMYIEQANHHPTWENTWNKVKIRLQTHDAGNLVTEKDRALARKMDHVYEKYMQA